MATDDERREVARRLRELRSGWSSGECYYTIIHALGLPDTSREDGGAELYVRLADLIEPVDRMCLYYDADTNHCGCYDTRLIDREALLALADEISDTSCDNRGELSVSLGDIWGWSQAIREALGVQDA